MTEKPIDQIVGDALDTLWEHPINGNAYRELRADTVQAVRQYADKVEDLPAREEADAILEEWPGGLDEIEASLAGHKRIIAELEANTGGLSSKEIPVVIRAALTLAVGKDWYFADETPILAAATWIERLGRERIQPAERANGAPPLQPKRIAG